MTKTSPSQVAAKLKAKRDWAAQAPARAALALLSDRELIDRCKRLLAPDEQSNVTEPVLEPSVR